MASAQPKTAEHAVKQTARTIAQQSRKVADQAAETKHAAAAIETSADLNTRLAADRNILAAERTYAAWVRTGLFALASGIGAKTLLHGSIPDWLNSANSSLLVLFSAFCFVAAVWRHINPAPPPPLPQLHQIPRGALIAMNGFLALVSLAALIGIWFGAPLVAAHAVPPA